MPMNLRGTMKRKHDQCVKHLVTLQRYMIDLEEYSQSRFPELRLEYLEIYDTCSEIMAQIRKLRKQI